MLHIITSTGDRLFKFVNIDDLNDLEPSKKEFIVKFLQFLTAAHISTVNCDEIAGDRPRLLYLRMKFSALNVDLAAQVLTR